MCRVAKTNRSGQYALAPLRPWVWAFSLAGWVCFTAVGVAWGEDPLPVAIAPAEATVSAEGGSTDEAAIGGATAEADAALRVVEVCPAAEMELPDAAPPGVATENPSAAAGAGPASTEAGAAMPPAQWSALSTKPTIGWRVTLRSSGAAVPSASPYAAGAESLEVPTAATPIPALEPARSPAGATGEWEPATLTGPASAEAIPLAAGSILEAANPTAASISGVGASDAAGVTGSVPAAGSPHQASPISTTVPQASGEVRRAAYAAAAEGPSQATLVTANEPLIGPPAAGAPLAIAEIEPAQPGPPTRVEDRDPNFSFEVLDHSAELTVMMHRSKLLRSAANVYRIAVVDPAICDVNQFTPREMSVIGRSQGATHVTFWFEEEGRAPVTYLVRVTPDVETQKRREEQYHLFEEMLSELFPDSKVQLVPVSDKLIVKGQAKDAEEATQILTVVRHQASGGGGGWGGGGAGGWGGGGGFGFAGSISEGLAAEPLVGPGTSIGRMLPPSQVINMLRIPGVQQVALRVKIAELNREKARRFGVDLDMRFEDGNVVLRSLLNVASGSAATVVGSFDADQINFGVHYLEREGVVRLLSEPTLVTLSGRPARFVAGGEFAVPTVVGVGGASAVTTDFRAFGAIIFFLPTVLDKDRIRLQVSPEFSELNRSNAVSLSGGGSIPGLNTKAVSTTVEMREGQTLAIAGLLSDGMRADISGNVPLLWRALGLRTVERKEAELLILVTPELVQPMEPEEVPPLPGFDVTEPTNTEFFLMGRLEGRPTLEYRSTVWPRLRQRYQHGGPAMISGPFGHGR